MNNEINRLENITPKVQSVFQRLLKINSHYAVLMAIDMLLAGVDTVSNAFDCSTVHTYLQNEKFNRLLLQLQLYYIYWLKIQKNKKNFDLR